MKNCLEKVQCFSSFIWWSVVRVSGIFLVSWRRRKRKRIYIVYRAGNSYLTYGVTLGKELQKIED